MKDHGSLASHDFASLVQELHEQRWTGLLTLTNAGVGRSVTVQDGRMVFASSSSPDDRMGALLLRRGRVSLRDLSMATDLLVATRKRLGAVLVEQGVLSPRDLISAVVEHAQEILYGAFQWTEGQYRLQASVPDEEAITLRMSTPDIILEGIRRIESWTRISGAVGGLDACYQRMPDYARTVAGMRLPPENAGLLRRLDTPKTVGELCGDPALPDFELCRTLWAFRVIGLVRRIDDGGGAAAVEDESLGIVVPEE